jgi:hypothetical protein
LGLGQSDQCAFVDFSVTFDLFAPEVLPRFWPLEQVTIMPMPETAMNEDYGPVLGKHKVWLAWQAPVVEHIAKAFCMEASPDC